LQELQTALHIAARQGDVDGVELLLQRGAAPNVVTTDLNTPLHGAAREGHDNVAKVLVDHGANMELANKVRASVNHRSGRSTLNLTYISLYLWHLPGPFLLSYSVFVFSFSLFFLFYAVLSTQYSIGWPSRQLLSARYYTVSYRICLAVFLLVCQQDFYLKLWREFS